MSMLSIRKLEGDFENILVRDVQTQVAAHVQIPVGAASRRVVVAMPAGKAALGFETAQPAGWTLEDELRPFADADGQRGVEFALVSNEAEISIPTASILLHHTLMARFGIDPDRKNENRLKDLFRSGEIAALETRLGFSLRDLSDRGHVVGPVLDGSGRAAFAKRALDGRHHYRLEFAGDGATDVHATDGHLRFSRPCAAAGAPLRLIVRASTDFPPLAPMPFAELVNDRGRELAAQDPHFAQAIRNFEFLSYREKFLAGSWNFLSYFGRDTLIALRIMWSVLSPLAKRTGVQSVLNEISPDGIVNVTDEWTDDRATMDALERFFHECDHGDVAGAQRTMQTILAGRVPEHPFFDVLDQTFLFPAAASRWFRELNDAEWTAWLRTDHAVLGRTESNLATLLRNWNYLLNAAAPYAAAWRELRARHPGLAPRALIETRRAEFGELRRWLVGSIASAANWRDTYQLPWHFRSEDINVNLLPMAIAAMCDAVARLDAGGLRLEALALAQRLALDAIRDHLAEPDRFDAVQEAWNWDALREHFLVHRTPADMRRDFQRYLGGLESGAAIWGERERGLREREAFLRCRADGTTVAEFLRGGRAPAAAENGVEFTALLLDPAGQPLPLMHSDDVFTLAFGDPSVEQVRKIVQPFALAYPFGLGFLEDDAGVAVTNVAYSPPDTPALQDNWKNTWIKFGPDEYHGRSAWPWVMFALIAGIRDQALKNIDAAGRLQNGLAPADVALFSRVLEKMKTSLAKLGPLATSEVFKYAPARTGTGIWQAEPMGISTPIQLWSAAPARRLIDEALARIALADR